MSNVWTASPVAINFHIVPGGERKTPCGRWYGDAADGQPVRGRFETREAAEARGRKECARCYGHGVVVKPRIGIRKEPSRGSRW